jgi:hypothetical protein
VVRRRLVRGLLAPVCLALAACSGDDGATSGEWVIDTLETGSIRTVNRATPQPIEGAPLELEPVFRLGTAEGPEETVFGAISGVEVDDEGRIYVLDRQANELRIFTADGEHVRTTGRSGDGPGEFSAANGLRWATPDTLVIVDQSGGRYSFVSRDGDFARTARRELGYFSWMFDGAFIDGRVFEIGLADLGGEGWETAIIAVPTGKEGAGDTISVPPSAGPEAEAFSVRTEVGGMSMGVPFAARRVLHVDDTGHLWHGHGSEFRIFRSTLDGDTLREIRVEVEPIPVTHAEIDEWRAGEGVERFVEMGGDLDLGRIPEFKPRFDGLYRDPDGYLWVSVPAGDRESRFIVLDSEGRFVADFHLEGVARTPGLAPRVRGDRLYLVGRDDFDVEGVEVFRIRR